MSAIFNFIELKILRTYPSLKPHLLFNGNGLAIWNDWPAIKHIKVKRGRRSPFLYLIKLTFFMVYPYLKPHILFNSNDLDISSGFPDDPHVRKIFWPP